MDHDGKDEKRSLFKRLRDRLSPGGSAHVDLEAGVLVARPDAWHTVEVPLSRIHRIEAGNRDTFTNDTVFVFFHVDEGQGAVLSEFDKGFAQVIIDLRERFPGIEGWQAAVPAVPFQLTSVDLWRREVPEEPEEPPPL